VRSAARVPSVSRLHGTGRPGHALSDSGRPFDVDCGPSRPPKRARTGFRRLNRGRRRRQSTTASESPDSRRRHLDAVGSTGTRVAQKTRNASHRKLVNCMLRYRNFLSGRPVVDRSHTAERGGIRRDRTRRRDGGPLVLFSSHTCRIIPPKIGRSVSLMRIYSLEYRPYVFPILDTFSVRQCIGYYGSLYWVLRVLMRVLVRDNRSWIDSRTTNGGISDRSVISGGGV
jgi:hypothetical protein